MITILTPAYNREKMVGKAIKSVIGQTDGNWRLVVYDDGSTDGTREIVRSFDDKRISLVCGGVNGGIVAARNALLDACDTKYACWLDSDDMCSIYRVQFMYSKMIGEDLDILWSNWHPFMFNPTSDKNKIPDCRQTPRVVKTMPHHFPTMMFNREKAPRFQEVLFEGTPTTLSGEDREWYTRFKQAGIKEGQTDRVLYYYRRHYQRVTAWSRLPDTNRDWYDRMVAKVQRPT